MATSVVLRLRPFQVEREAAGYEPAAAGVDSAAGIDGARRLRCRRANPLAYGKRARRSAMADANRSLGVFASGQRAVSRIRACCGR